MMTSLNIRVGVGILTSAIFAIVFWQRILINDVSDLHEHIEYARRISGVADISSPHFLFQLLIKAINALSPLSLEAATALLLGFCYGGMAFMITSEIIRRHPVVPEIYAATAAFAVLIASHIFLLTILVPNFYYGYLVTTAYHNPSQQLNKLLALAIWLLYCRAFLLGREIKMPTMVGMATLCLLSAVAKPSFLIAFLPVSGLIAAFDLFCCRWKRAGAYALAVAIPSVAVLGWQFAMTYGGAGGLGIDPFGVVPPRYVVTLPLSLAFPIAVACLLWRESLRSETLLLAWAMLLLGLLYTIFLAEEGQRKLQGNFVWTAQTGAFLLYVESTFLAMRAKGKKRPVLVAVAMLHIICGVIYVVANALFPAQQWL